MCTDSSRAAASARGGLGAVLAMGKPLELTTAVCGCWWPLCSSETEMKPSLPPTSHALKQLVLPSRILPTQYIF